MKTLQTTFLDHTQRATPERYDEMLGVLPPERMATNGFLVGEPVDHQGGRARYDLFYSETDDMGISYYYAGLATTRNWDTWLLPTTDQQREEAHAYAAIGREDYNAD